MTDRLAPLAHRIADAVDDITTAAEYLVADGAHQDAADIEDEQSRLTELISPIDPGQGDPLDQADYNRALEVITILLNDAISFHLGLTRLELTRSYHDARIVDIARRNNQA